MKSALLSGVILLGAFTNTESETGKAEMSWDNTTIDLGNIPRNEPAEVEFAFTNSGEEALVINNVRPSCGCTVADYPHTPIAPGETATVKATYNARSVGAFRKTVTVTANSEQGTYVLTLKGVVIE